MEKIINWTIWTQVARSIRGVGDKLASKVWEVVCSGRLRKVQEVCGSEETTTITRFLGVWGAGPATARGWYVQVRLRSGTSTFVASALLICAGTWLVHSWNITTTCWDIASTH